MKEHLRKKRSDLDGNLSSLKAFFRLPHTTHLGRKAITAAKFLIATTLLIAILFFSSRITAQDEFSIEQTPNGNGGELGIMTDISGCANITSPGVYFLNATKTGLSHKHCININSSDVYLNGQGFLLYAASASTGIGIYIDNSTSSFTNITIFNISLKDWRWGIVMNNTIGGAIINNTITTTTQGISIADSMRINITGNNDISDTTGGLNIVNLTYCDISNNNFTGAPRGILATSLQSCNITSNNVSRHTQIGIWINTGNNLIISNNENTGSNYGLFIYNVSNSTISQNNFTSNAGTSGIGMIAYFSQYNNITDNNLSKNSNYGISFAESNSYNLIENNIINGGTGSLSKGIYLNSSYNTVINNIANSNYYGFTINRSYYNNITNNTANSNNMYGVSMISGENNTFTNNTLNNNSHGIYSLYGRNNQFANNIIDFNNRSGIFLVISGNNYFLNNTARNNNVWDVNITGYNNTFTNLTIGPIISFMSNNISLKNMSSPAADPSGAINISKWINATNTSANSWLFLNISYTTTEIGALNESLFILGRYKSGAWETTSSAFASPSGVVAGSNYVFANITSFSIFAPLEFTAVAGDTTAPVSVLDLPANNTFKNTSLVAFNCSATDETGLSNVTLFSNINGSWSENLTYAISGTSNQTNLTVTGIADGTYIWNCLVKDTSNNQAFNSTNYTITIDTTVPLDITLNSPEEVYSSTDTTVIFNFSATDNLDTNLTCNVTVDSLSAARINVSNGTSRTTSVSVSASSHQWNVTCYDNAGNSNSSITRNFTITAASTSPSTGGGSSGGSGGTITPVVPPEPEPEPTIEEPEPIIEEPEPENIIPIFEPILGSVFEDIIENSEQLELVLESRRTERGVEVLFGGKARLEIEGGGKKKIKIDLNDYGMNLITGRTIEPLVVKSDWWILFVILIILTYGSVHRWFKEYGLTVTQAAAIKQLKANLKESDKKPNQETLDKSWTIFSKYIVTELKVKRATLNTLLYAIIERNDKLGPDFYNIFEELWQKKGKDLTKEDLKNITKKMIKLIKRLG